MSTENRDSQPTPEVLPSKLPEPTGNHVVDVSQRVKHILDVPCARNAFLSGIAGGAGMGFIRGISSNPLIAANWAIGTFIVLSSASWHMCQKKFADEREQVRQIMEANSNKRARGENSSAGQDKETSGAL
ncbi:hypothetical protein D9619_007353 [Psilocybe cf. subviscida]|uniref:Cytochrome c oxidase assembly protein COX20, mitochondrial n=1 Tax=Psilocybe cf. subviscida TaxID=2480587 RepID=A0A8H5B207_9AGAR|nr:hypothetical protein D9619_007353 [Psilocybe cf. subviscida]